MKHSTLFTLGVLAFLVSSCAPQDQAGEQHKAQVVQANDEMLNQGNLDFADEIFSSDYAGRGPDMIKEFVGNLREAFPDLQVKIDPLIAEGNMTAWRRTHTGTHQGGYAGFPPTGKKITWEDFVITRYENGMIAEEWGAGNLEEVLRRESEGAHKTEEVIAALEATIEALNNKDAKTYAKYLHPEQTRFLPQSADLFRGFSVEAMEKDFQNGMEFNMQMEDLDVAFYGNTAIVTGYQTGPHHLPDGRIIDGKRKYSIVFVNEAGQWKSVHLHTGK